MIRPSTKLVRKFFNPNQQFVRGNNVIVTYPRVRTPFPEKVFMGIIFFVGVMAVPTYICLNMKHYRGPPAQ